MKSTTDIFIQGMRDGIPIALGYYAVAFSIGIIAGNCGISPVEGFLGSLFTRASAGEYGVYTLIADNAVYLEVIVMCLITNLRYLLMSTALTQKFAPGTSLLKRMLTACCVTDEVFGISIAYKGYLAPAYTIGAMTIAGPAWAAGCMSGIIAGDILPEITVKSLSVALYGMFIAIIVPPSKNNLTIRAAVALSFTLSWLCAVTPFVKELSIGTRTMTLTIVIAALAAWLKPIKTNEDA